MEIFIVMTNKVMQRACRQQCKAYGQLLVFVKRASYQYPDEKHVQANQARVLVTVKTLLDYPQRQGHEGDRKCGQFLFVLNVL